MHIERGIPRPKRKMGQRKPKYPFDDLSIGDSFLVNGVLPRTPEYGHLKSLMVYYSQSRPGRKFSIRSDERGARVWRVV